MHDRPMSEESVFSEQFAMIGSDRDVGVSRYHIEKLLDHRIHIAHCLDLTLLKFGEFPRVERWGAPPKLSADDMLIEMLEHAMHAADPGPLILRLARQGVRIMRLTGI